jgi:hypothetical protein
MTKELFLAMQEKYADTINEMRRSAYALHNSVNQKYGKIHPYGYHLDMTVQSIRDFGYLVCAREEDVLPLFFGGYFHDSIEDARLSYNDVMKVARSMMTDEQAYMATEIVYALTNDKGRTRSERAGEKYYKGIRETPYAPFVKLCDRYANIYYTCSNDKGKSTRMREVYKSEVPHFLHSIDPHSEDMRLLVPKELIEVLAECLLNEMEREERERYRNLMLHQ